MGTPVGAGWDPDYRPPNWRHASGLIAHEIAHQWWGVSVTCTDWRHFWLNEGFATFMAAVYMGHRYGEAEYTKHVERWKARWQRLRSAGTDHALVYERWDKPTADDRAVVYQKAAYVLHMLRQELGEKTFWNGIRAYTRANQGRSVDTQVFRDAMSRASGRDLLHFFTTLVDCLGPTDAAMITIADPCASLNENDNSSSTELSRLVCCRRAFCRV